MINYKDLGERVREGRKSLGLTQEDLARRARVSRYTVWRVESGECGGVSFDVMTRILGGVGYELFAQKGIGPGEPAEPLSDSVIASIIAETYFSGGEGIRA